MIAGTIWTRLISTLENNPTLGEYVKYVYRGVKEFESIEPEGFPLIMLEPVSDGEIARDMNQIQDVIFSVDLYAFSTDSTNNPDNSIVGGQDYKGILDINNDIRACLSSSYTLGDTCIDIIIGTTLYDRIVSKYPIRGLVIPLRIKYRQVDGV